MSLRFSVTMYWCSTAAAGTRTPAILPTSRAQMPAALTRISQVILPWSVMTSVARRSLTVMPVTRTPSNILTPFMRAPFAKALHKLVGSTWPSVGMNAAPTTPSVVM